MKTRLSITCAAALLIAGPTLAQQYMPYPSYGYPGSGYGPMNDRSQMGQPGFSNDRYRMGEPYGRSPYGDYGRGGFDQRQYMPDDQRYGGYGRGGFDQRQNMWGERRYGGYGRGEPSQHPNMSGGQRYGGYARGEADQRQSMQGERTGQDYGTSLRGSEGRRNEGGGDYWQQQQYSERDIGQQGSSFSQGIPDEPTASGPSGRIGSSDRSGESGGASERMQSGTAGSGMTDHSGSGIQGDSQGGATGD